MTSAGLPLGSLLTDSPPWCFPHPLHTDSQTHRANPAPVTKGRPVLCGLSQAPNESWGPQRPFKLSMLKQSLAEEAH